jgi:hypothetical protein
VGGDSEVLRKENKREKKKRSIWGIHRAKACAKRESKRKAKSTMQ